MCEARVAPRAYAGARAPTRCDRRNAHGLPLLHVSVHDKFHTSIICLVFLSFSLIESKPNCKLVFFEPHIIQRSRTDKKILNNSFRNMQVNTFAKWTHVKRNIIRRILWTWTFKSSFQWNILKANLSRPVSTDRSQLIVRTMHVFEPLINLTKGSLLTTKLNWKFIYNYTRTACHILLRAYFIS